jgi:DNA-binding NtrC family response regulator
MATHSIAVVDADEAFLELMRERLGAAGYIVQTFANPDGAYALLRNEPPSAAIVGLQFPDCQPSIDLATALKLHRATRGLPVILTSDDAVRLRQYVERLRHRGVTALWALPKPLDPATSLRIFARALGSLEREAP